MIVHVGSTNPAKVQAVRNVLPRRFDVDEVVPRDVATGVPDQPADGAIWAGARTRAGNALDGDADLGVGIEAGLVRPPEGPRLDVQVCAIVDRDGRTTLGHGPGFAYPPRVLEAVDAGEEVGDVMSAISGIDDVGAKQGAIGVLTDGAIDRTALTEWAVWMALVPRIREDLYDG